MSAPRATGLFRAIRQKAAVDARQGPLMADLPVQRAPEPERDPLDYDPTPGHATRAFLARERTHIAAWGDQVWEPAAGGGHMARELQRAGFEVFSSDIVDRGWPLDACRSFFDYDYGQAPARTHITNPPYNLISAKHGRGEWLRHAILLDAPYIALLLNSSWVHAVINGHRELLETFPPSIEYRCAFRIDFRGKGSPTMASSWLVWDRNRPPQADNTWTCTTLADDPGDLDGQGELL